MSRRSSLVASFSLFGVAFVTAVAGCGSSSNDEALFGSTGTGTGAGAGTGAGTGGTPGTGTGGATTGFGGSSSVGGSAGGDGGTTGGASPGAGGKGAATGHGGNGVGGNAGTSSAGGATTQGLGGAPVGPGGTTGQGGAPVGEGGAPAGPGGAPAGVGGMTTQGTGGSTSGPPMTCEQTHGVKGCCSADGTTLYWWDNTNNQVVVTDCTAKAQTCSWTMGSMSMLYDCTTGKSGDPSGQYPYTCGGAPVAGACTGTATGAGGNGGVTCGGIMCSTQDGPPCCAGDICGIDVGGVCVPPGTTTGAGGGSGDPAQQDCIAFQASPNKNSTECSTCLQSSCMKETTAASQCATQGQGCHSSCGTDNACVCTCELSAANGCGAAYKKYFTCISDNCSTPCD